MKKEQDVQSKFDWCRTSYNLTRWAIRSNPGHPEIRERLRIMNEWKEALLALAWVLGVQMADADINDPEILKIEESLIQKELS